MSDAKSVFAKGNTALITGAASGVGLAVAQMCAKHGMNLALVDRNQDLLTRAKDELSKQVKVEAYPLDVSDLSQWSDLLPKFRAAYPRVDFLLLNAGIQFKSGWDDAEYFHKIMDTNLFGVVHGLNTFYPMITAQSTPSAIILTGSKQGITNPPGNPAYNASKAAIKSLAESLSFDLRGTPVSIHLLVPGWTFTGIAGGGGPDSTNEKPAGAWTPTQVAERLEEKVTAGEFWCICPDNDVSEEMDRKRMMWTAGDAVEGRPPLSRWREEWKNRAEEWMSRQKM